MLIYSEKLSKTKIYESSSHRYYFRIFFVDNIFTSRFPAYLTGSRHAFAHLTQINNDIILQKLEAEAKRVYFELVSFTPG